MDDRPADASGATRCPGCAKPMRELPLEAVLGRTVSISVCAKCRAFWFEPFESLHLTRQSTLQLFEVIGSLPQPCGPAPFPPVCRCPVCDARLLHTFDRQRNTPFEYLRCDGGHGRFTRFVDFLKEKDYVRRLTREQIAELRQSLPTVRCSGCGASIDLGERTVCSHCGTAVSMLDLRKLMKLSAGAATDRTQSKEAPAPPALTGEQISALFAAAKIDREREESSSSLVDVGLRLFADWLKR